MKHQNKTAYPARRVPGTTLLLGTWNRLTFALTALVLGLPLARATDVSIVQSGTVASTVVPWNRTLNFNKFDPDLGTLGQVTLTLVGSVRGDLKVENQNTFSNSVSVTLFINGMVTAQRPNMSALATASPMVSVNYLLPTSDGRLDFLGASGRSTNLQANASVVYNAILPSSDVALFTGTAAGQPVSLPVVANATGGFTATPTTNNITAQFPNRLCGANLTLTYTYTPRAPRISGIVWNDADGNAYNDTGEVGIAGATVTLADAGGTPLAGYAPTTTDANGYYKFEAVPDGNYVVMVAPLAGFIETYDLDGVETPDRAAVTVAGADRNDVYFGYQQRTSSLGDRVWADINGNQVQDADEPGIPGVRVALLNEFGDELDHQTTDANGSYNFANLASGYFQVAVSNVPAGYVETYDLDGVETPDITWVYLAPDQAFADADFGYQPLTGSLAGLVWNDKDRDGAVASGEPALPGAVVHLLGMTSSSSSSVELASTSTDASGHYQFDQLAAGTYTVVIEQPPGYAPTSDGDGLGTPNAASYALASGENYGQLDFGYDQGGLGDRIWNDRNSNGLQEADEPGIPGATVTLSDSSGPLAVTTTDPNGFYTFGDLPDGTYTVTVAPPTGFTETYDVDGLISANAATVTLTPGQERMDVDFGYREETGSIGDRVWRDDDGNGIQNAGEVGLAGVTLTLADSGGTPLASVVSDANGYYSFSSVPAGTYTVATDQPVNFIPTGPESVPVTLLPGEARTDVDFGYQELAQIGGMVWDDANNSGALDGGEAVLAGIAVAVSGSSGNFSTSTDASGHYLLSGLVPATYTVSITPPAGSVPTYDLDGTATPNSATVAVNPGEARSDVNFGVRALGSIGDRLWNDANGNGVQDAGEGGLTGTLVTLRTSGGTVLAVTTSGANGAYSFGGLAPGTYRVSVTVPVFVSLTPTFDLDGVGTPNTALVALNEGQNRTDVDFGYQPASPDDSGVSVGAIGDLVWRDDNGNGIQDGSEPGLGGLTVTLSTGGSVIRTTTTAANGSYSFPLLSAGTYTVDVSAPGYDPDYDVDGVGTPNTATVSLADGQYRADVDFGYQTEVPPPPQNTASVGDRVWSDDNGNGLQDAGEAGISGLTVTLVGSGGATVATTTTGADGAYGFSSLYAGTYTVVVTAPANNAETYDLDGLGSPNAATVVLATDDHRTDVDFGYQAYASIGDLVWRDDNNNGVQDTGEPGLANLTVTATGPGGTVKTTTTDANGFYHLSLLTPGNYTVSVTPTVGYVPSYDLDGIGTPNSAMVTVAAHQDRTDVDFGYRPPPTASIGDRVWSDDDGNGLQNVGEAGMPGVTVTLRDSNGATVATTTTGADGAYVFSSLYGGTYSVTVTAPANSAQTYDLDGLASPNVATVVLATDEHRTDVDFGYQANASIGDLVWRDDNNNGVQDAGEPGLANLAVTATGPGGTVKTTTTDNGGFYHFNQLTPGTYTIEVTAPGLVPVYDLDGVGTPSTATVTVVANQNRTDVDFGYIYYSEPPPCQTGVIGGINLGGIINNYLFLFADGHKDANWQGATKGFAGSVAVNGILAAERTSGGVAYAGTIQTSDSTLSAWQQIVNHNAGQAFASYNNAALINTLKTRLVAAFSQINGLPVTPGYANRSATSLDGLNTQDGIATTYVINIRSGFQVSSKIDITGDAGDIFILRWDTDANPANGYQGTVKFQSGGAIVPHGGLTAANFIHVAGDIDASGGGSTPPPPYPQGPRLNNGQGPLIAGAANFSGGGFFTGYWLTTGDPVTGETHALSNAIFVGGWYTLTTKFSMTSGTSGVYVGPNCP